MTCSGTQYVVWVTRGDTKPLADTLLRERAGVADSGVEVRTETLGTWQEAVIPAGSRDEWGTVLAEVLNVGSNELPPEGRVYVVEPT